MKELTKEQLYKKNQKAIKVLGICTPIVFWLLLALGVLCFCLAISRSMENVNEIYALLDSKTYNDTQLQENYNALVEKYGELCVGTGSNGFTIHFIDVKSAIFSAFIVANGVFSVIFILGAFILGKWVLPALKKHIELENQDMVNLTILKDK